MYLKPYWLFAGRQDELALYEVAQYKGLEADVIVLVIPDVVSDIAQQLYVGASRARGYLELVISEPAYARAPRLRK